MKTKRQLILLLTFVCAFLFAAEPAAARKVYIVKYTNGETRVIDPAKKTVWYNVTHPISFIKTSLSSDDDTCSMRTPITQKDMEKKEDSVVKNATDTVTDTAKTGAKTATSVAKTLLGQSYKSSN